MAGGELAQRALAIVLAGGHGARLGELTRWHSKPALPFGGQYCNIDFPLSNCVNSGIRRIALLTQYKAHSLIQHVQQGWGFLPSELGEFVEIWPAQQRLGEEWYAGTADAIWQNLDLIEALAPEHVIVLAGDHIYRMDYRQMLEAHERSGATVTVGAVEVPVESASSFGVMRIDAAGRVLEFQEKPAVPAPSPHAPGTVLASMGIYAFSRRQLVALLRADAARARSSHDFGRDVVPAAVAAGGAVAHVFRDPTTERAAYWRDVGTLDSYWGANMELLGEPPAFDLHDRRWPLWTRQPQSPPPQFVGAGLAQRSIVSAGCRVAGRVEHSALSPDCTVHPGASVAGCVLLPNVVVGRDCRIQRAVVDRGVRIPDGTVIGETAADNETYHVSPNGVRLVTAATLEPASAARRGPGRVAVA
jgi:glucose-1-phosphate adenylyltransferase